MSYDDRCDEIRVGTHNDVLHNMNKGMKAHYASDFKAGNKYLRLAEAGIERLFTQSVSKKAASYIVNEKTVPYRGEDFEAVMVHLFMALNYVFMELWEEALVEARKVDNRLNVINAGYAPDMRNAYDEDAFVRFIMGLLYEAQNEVNDAYISYKKAENGYKKYRRLYGVATPKVLSDKTTDVSSGNLRY